MIKACSMQFIRNDAIEAAFITMMNKLLYGHRTILRPLLMPCAVQTTRAISKVAELESRMEEALNGAGY